MSSFYYHYYMLPLQRNNEFRSLTIEILYSTFNALFLYKYTAMSDRNLHFTIANIAREA